MLGISTQLQEQIVSTIQELGCVYAGSEFFNSSVPLLRIYVEGPEHTNANLDQITAISRQLNALFDVEAPINGRYRVEVSSPGLDRRLFSLEDFQRFIGHEAKVRLHRAVEDRRNWVGIIKEVAQNSVVLEVEGVARTFEFDEIDKAHLVPKLKW
jgi:ribosome maturation factor RimP